MAISEARQCFNLLGGSLWNSSQDWEQHLRGSTVPSLHLVRQTQGLRSTTDRYTEFQRPVYRARGVQPRGAGRNREEINNNRQGASDSSERQNRYINSLMMSKYLENTLQE